MKLGIIGSPKSIEIIRDTITENNLYIEAIYIEYNHYTEVVELVKKYQPEVNALLFTGTTPFNYASTFIQPSVPWEYLPRNQISFLCSLVKSIHFNNYNLGNISLDSYGEKIVRSTFKELSCDNDSINIYIAKFKPLEDDYIDQVFKFHLQNYIDGKASFCITGIDEIYQLLLENNIPCVKINPVSEIIISKLNKLRLDHEIKMNEDSEIATIAIDFRFCEELATFSKSDLQIYKNKSEAYEMIYVFAQHIGAAIYQEVDNIYYLITSKSKLENETNNFKSISLLKESTQNILIKYLYLGIGLGKNPCDSKCNARLALQKSRLSNMSCMFIAYEYGKIVGPITYVPKYSEPSEINKRLLNISTETGIGITTLNKLENLIDQYKIEIITPRELARISDLTPRSINRILSKLELYGYVKVVGKEPNISSGRPSRIISINL